jgi:DNA primase
MNELKDRILDLDIVTTIGRYVELKPAGANYRGCCPIHKEKTPSFMVSPSKNIWKCFGCSKGGNLIDFVMELKGLDFKEALHTLARENNIEIPKYNATPEQKKQDDHRDSLMTVNQIAAKWFKEQLFLEENALALEYALSRWNIETIKLWDIGFAPDQMQPHGYTQDLKKPILLEAGLIRESDKNPGLYYNTFRNRLIIPIHNKYGKVIAFTARDLSGKDDVPKYINSPETPIYTKGTTLFGIHQAQKSIRTKGFAYLVEGNPDVIRLHSIEINNTVASSGTALTIDQVNILKAICKSVNIIGDTDSAGQKAVRSSAELLIKNGLPVNIVSLPSGEKKEDPDSFFTSEKQFKEYLATDQGKPRDYIFLLAEEWKKKANNPDFKARALDEISDLIIHFSDPSMHELYIEQLGKILPPKKAWADKIKYLLKENEPAQDSEDLPEGVDASLFLKYGFFEKNNCYYFRTQKGIERGCNFVMKPLFHIPSVIKAKRLYEIRNVNGETHIIEFFQSDLVALARFKEKVEGLGNFLWEKGDVELNKLKRYLYEQTETCIEITQLGWQKYGFYAWSNGIYNGEFNKVDDFGIVKHEGINYYLPAFSSIYKNEDLLFMSERRFVHQDGSITFYDYSKLLIEVFGDNAIIALCFYMGTLFRDYIVRLNNFFPLLNLFGPKGTGKTELALSLLQFFGRQSKGPNINNTTKPALANHVAQLNNAITHIDEFKNNIEFEKIEFLKGLWDGTGRSRMNMDKDKKMEATAVDVGIILSGQEMPTADIALFSRLVFLSFYKSEHTDKENEKFKYLKEIEKQGLTHITHELLKHRKFFIDNYRDSVDKVNADINAAIKNEIIEDRTFRNWVAIIAAFATLQEKVHLPFNYKQVIALAAQLIRVQNKETKKSNEVSTFWHLLQYLESDGLIQNDVDFKVEYLPKLKTDLVDVVWMEPKNVLFMQHSRIIPLYRKHGKMHGENVLPANSIDYYLRNDKRFLGKKLVAFKAINPKTGVEETDSAGRKKRKVTNAYAFLYDDLNLDLVPDVEEDEELFGKKEKVAGGPDDRITASKEKEDIPF